MSDFLNESIKDKLRTEDKNNMFLGIYTLKTFI